MKIRLPALIMMTVMLSCLPTKAGTYNYYEGNIKNTILDYAHENDLISGAYVEAEEQDLLENTQEKKVKNETGQWIYDDADYIDKGLPGKFALNVRDLFLLTIFPITIILGIASIVISFISLVFYSFNIDRYDEIHYIKELKKANDSIKLRYLLSRKHESNIINNNVVGRYGFYKTYIAPDIKAIGLLWKNLDRFYSSGLEAFVSMIGKYVIGITLLMCLGGLQFVTITSKVGGVVGYNYIKPTMENIPKKISGFMLDNDITIGDNEWSNSLTGVNKKKIKDSIMKCLKEYSKEQISDDTRQSLIDTLEIYFHEYVDSLSNQSDKVNLLCRSLNVETQIVHLDNIEQSLYASNAKALVSQLDSVKNNQIKNPKPTQEDIDNEKKIKEKQENLELMVDNTETKSFEKEIKVNEIGFPSTSDVLKIKIMFTPNNLYSVGGLTKVVTDKPCWKYYSEIGPDETRTYKSLVKGKYKDVTVVGKVVKTTFSFDIGQRKSSFGRLSLNSIGNVVSTYYNDTEILNEDNSIKCSTKPVKFYKNGNIIYFTVSSFEPKETKKDFNGVNISSDASKQYRISTPDTINSVQINNVEYLAYDLVSSKDGNKVIKKAKDPLNLSTFNIDTTKDIDIQDNLLMEDMKNADLKITHKKSKLIKKETFYLY